MENVNIFSKHISLKQSNEEIHNKRLKITKSVWMHRFPFTAGQVFCHVGACWGFKSGQERPKSDQERLKSGQEQLKSDPRAAKSDSRAAKSGSRAT